jgi:hypothetical protein
MIGADARRGFQRWPHMGEFESRLHVFNGIDHRKLRSGDAEHQLRQLLCSDL